MSATRGDGVLVGLALLHGVVLVAAPPAVVIALGMWWTSNTIAHNFIHRPFFRSPSLNACFSAYLSLLVGVPQTLWRERHLAHHGQVRWRLRVSRMLLTEAVLVAAAWSMLALLAPPFFFAVYLPGFAAGLALCAVQGHHEHAGGTTSHYGFLYNTLCFNDGYHVEHHARPWLHWTRLSGAADLDARASRWPPLFRWLESINLETLERVVLRSALLQRFVVRAHCRAVSRLLPSVPDIRRVAIIGGGLFPRTAMVIKELLPDAAIVIVDANADNLTTARTFLGSGPSYVHARYEPGTDIADADLVVVPLAFQGSRGEVYRRPPARAVLVHDWLWHAQGTSRIVSLGLLKRINLVYR